MRRTALAATVVLVSAGFAWAAEKIPAATQGAHSGDVVGDWGEKTGGLQVRLVVKAGAARGGQLPVVAEIKNSSDARTPQKQLRVWLMIAQGAQHAYYSDPVAVGPHTLAAGETISVPIKSGELAAYRYVAGLELREGVPVPTDPKAPRPQSVGKVSEVVPAGTVKLRAFFVVSQDIDPELKEKIKTQVISSATVTAKIAEKAGE